MKSYLGLLFFALSSLASPDYIFNDYVGDAVALIDKDRWFEDVKILASFNRYYRHPQIVDARDRIVDIFTTIGLETRLEEITINHTPGHNVIAEIKGTEKPEDIYIIGAHYDSISEIPRTRAPGAEDNASGTAALFEIARALKERAPKATVRFVAFSGEEAGLIGSAQHVKNIIKAGDKNKIRGVLIMDMIAYSQDDDLDILFETNRANEELVSLLSASAKKFSRARIEHTYEPWGSDHMPFLAESFTTALVIENDYQDYPDYHRSTDDIANLNKDMAFEILKTIVGTLGFWVY